MDDFGWITDVTVDWVLEACRYLHALLRLTELVTYREDGGFVSNNNWTALYSLAAVVYLGQSAVGYLVCRLINQTTTETLPNAMRFCAVLTGFFCRIRHISTFGQ